MDVTVVGLGYVGTVVAAALAAADHAVLGVEIDRRKLDALAGGESPVHEPGLGDLLRDGLDRDTLRFVHPDDFAPGETGEVVFITVGTPPSTHGTTDLSQVHSALEWVRSVAEAGTIVAMKSTVPPGTGKRVMAGALRDSGLRYVANPEFLREGRALEDWHDPDRTVIGGEDPDAVETLRKLFSDVKGPVIVTDTTTAEMIKYGANAFLATKISFINEIAHLCDLVGADVKVAAEGLGLDPRIGRQFLGAGIGYGGSCFPKDVRALELLATENGHVFELLRAVIDVNNRQRLLPLRALLEALGSLEGVRVAVLGLAFKPGTDDVREAPSLDIIANLVEAGADVVATDPVAVAGAYELLPGQVTLTDSPLEALDGARAAVLVTEWPELVGLPWESVARTMAEPRIVFDGRNALDPGRLTSLGFRYHAVGRPGTS